MRSDGADVTAVLSNRQRSLNPTAGLIRIGEVHSLLCSAPERYAQFL